MLQSYAVYVYGADWPAARRNSFDETGTLTGYYLYEYDGDGNTTKYSSYDALDALDALKACYTYEYDSDWTLTHFRTYNTSDVMTYYSVHSYD